MKKTKWTIEIKEVKVRQPWAPKQKCFRDKKIYNRRALKLEGSY